MATVKRDIGTCKISAESLVFDIEGTTSSITFVKDILFPYIRKHLELYLNENWGSEDFQAHIESFRKQANQDTEDKLEGVIAIPEGGEEEVIKKALSNNIKWQMDNDKKTKCLKDLQGLIMEKGYTTGYLKGHVYDDVEQCFKVWAKENKSIYIYSSGSVHAQKLLFQHSEKGDLLPLIKGHFDTTIGMKFDVNSYKEILKNISSSPSETAFFTDVPKEARAAKEAGILAILVSREGNVPLTDEDKSEFKIITSFEDIEFEPNCKKIKLSPDISVTDVNKEIKSCPLSLDEKKEPDTLQSVNSDDINAVELMEIEEEIAEKEKEPEMTEEDIIYTNKEEQAVIDIQVKSDAQVKDEDPKENLGESANCESKSVDSEEINTKNDNENVNGSEDSAQIVAANSEKNTDNSNEILNEVIDKNEDKLLDSQNIKNEEALASTVEEYKEMKQKHNLTKENLSSLVETNSLSKEEVESKSVKDHNEKSEEKLTNTLDTSVKANNLSKEEVESTSMKDHNEKAEEKLTNTLVTCVETNSLPKVEVESASMKNHNEKAEEMLTNMLDTSEKTNNLSKEEVESTSMKDHNEKGEEKLTNTLVTCVETSSLPKEEVESTSMKNHNEKAEEKLTITLVTSVEDKNANGGKEEEKLPSTLVTSAEDIHMNGGKAEESKEDFLKTSTDAELKEDTAVQNSVTETTNESNTSSGLGERDSEGKQDLEVNGIVGSDNEMSCKYIGKTQSISDEKQNNVPESEKKNEQDLQECSKNMEYNIKTNGDTSLTETEVPTNIKTKENGEDEPESQEGKENDILKNLAQNTQVTKAELLNGKASPSKTNEISDTEGNVTLEAKTLNGSSSPYIKEDNICIKETTVEGKICGDNSEKPPVVTVMED